MKKYTEQEVHERLIHLPLWEYKNKKLHRHLIFKDFREAFAFMEEVAKSAETLGHHPEWSNVYNQVDFYLSTHDIRGLSELDFTLAKKVDEIAASMLY